MVVRGPHHGAMEDFMGKNHQTTRATRESTTTRTGNHNSFRMRVTLMSAVKKRSITGWIVTDISISCSCWGRIACWKYHRSIIDTRQFMAVPSDGIFRACENEKDRF